jgi:hypothetical protein
MLSSDSRMYEAPVRTAITTVSGTGAALMPRGHRQARSAPRDGRAA